MLEFINEISMLYETKFGAMAKKNLPQIHELNYNS